MDTIEALARAYQIVTGCTYEKAVETAENRAARLTPEETPPTGDGVPDELTLLHAEMTVRHDEWAWKDASAMCQAADIWRGRISEMADAARQSA